MAPRVSADVPTVAWSEFLAGFDWRQGEHVSLIGPTGGGKTTLALAILPRREYVAIFATKPRDPTLTGLRKRGYVVTKTWPASSYSNRAILWPPIKRIPDDELGQQQTFYGALQKIYAAGGWCVYFDEVAYMVDPLRLSNLLAQFWQQGRSLNLSVVASTQRPARVPLLLYSQASHLFFWQTNDDRDLKRIGGLNGVSDRLVRETVARLPRHAVLYVDTRAGALVVTKVEGH